MLARKSALIVAVNVLNGALGYVALFFIARYMTPWEYGVVAFAYSFVALFEVFGDLGFGSAHIKLISEGKEPGVYNGTFLSIKFVLTAVLVAVTLCTLIFWKVVIGRGFESSTHELAVYIMLGYWSLRTFAYAFRYTFMARRNVAKMQLPMFLETLVRVVATIYVAMAGYGAIALALTYILGDIALFISYLYFFRGSPIARPSTAALKSYVPFAMPMALVVASSFLLINIDKVLLQLFWSAEVVGNYFAAFNLSRFINMFTVAIGLLLFPTFSALIAKNNQKEARSLLLRSERYTSMVVVPLVFGMVIFAEPATNILLSGAWKNVIPILQILPFFALFAALEQPYQSKLLGMNLPKLARNRIIIMVIVNIILNVLLIPKDIQSVNLRLAGFGASGAALATVIAYAIGLCYSRIMVYKLTKVKGNPRIFLHIFAGIVMTFILFFLLYQLDMILLITRWYILLGFAFLGLSIYLLVLYILKEFNKEDFHLFIDILNIKKMAKYILNDIKKEI